MAYRTEIGLIREILHHLKMAGNLLLRGSEKIPFRHGLEEGADPLRGIFPRQPAAHPRLNPPNLRTPVPPPAPPPLTPPNLRAAGPPPDPTFLLGLQNLEAL